MRLTLAAQFSHTYFFILVKFEDSIEYARVTSLMLELCLLIIQLNDNIGRQRCASGTIYYSN